MNAMDVDVLAIPPIELHWSNWTRWGALKGTSPMGLPSSGWLRSQSWGSAFSNYGRVPSSRMVVWTVIGKVPKSAWENGPPAGERVECTWLAATPFAGSSEESRRFPMGERWRLSC